MNSRPAHPKAISGFSAAVLNCRLGLALLASLQVIPSAHLYAAPRNGEGVIMAAKDQIRTAQQDGKARITVTGSRVSMGNAVDCPKIRTDEGEVFAVSYLAPSIAIGDRVVVTGYMAHMTTCLGPVLKAEKVVHQP